MVCPFIERKCNGYIDIAKPFGFSGFVGNFVDRDFDNHWSTFVKKHKYVCGYLGINPIFDFSGCFDPRNIYPFNTIYVMDLTPSMDDLFKKLSTNRKRQIKDWDKIRKILCHEKPALENFFWITISIFSQKKCCSHFIFFPGKPSRFYLIKKISSPGCT